MQGPSRVQLEWSSFSIPRSVIASEYLYKPDYILGSPFDVQFLLGLSTPSLCYVENWIYEAVAGDNLTFSVYSVNSRGELLDNPTDVFQVKFSGPSEVTFTSEYQINGRSSIRFILTKSGTYNVEVTLYGQELRDDTPKGISINPGNASAATSTSEFQTLVDSTTLVAGVPYSYNFVATDSYSNIVPSANFESSFTWQDIGNYASTIGVEPPADWATTYGTTLQGTVSEFQVTFSLFRAGDYQNNLRLDSALITESPIDFVIVPNEIHPPNSQAVYPDVSILASETYIFEIQSRDDFYNNAQTLTSSLGSYSISASHTNGLVVQGVLMNKLDATGVYQGKVTLTETGTYTLSTTINGLAIENPSHSVTVIAQVESDPAFTIIDNTVELSRQTGESWTFVITAKDEYGNIRPDAADTFQVTREGTIDTTLVDLAVTNNNDGTFVVEFVVTVVDTYTLKASLFQQVEVEIAVPEDDTETPTDDGGASTDLDGEVSTDVDGGAPTEGDGTTTEGDGTTTEGDGTSTEGDGTPTEGDGTTTESNGGASTEVDGTTTDSNGTESEEEQNDEPTEPQTEIIDIFTPILNSPISFSVTVSQIKALKSTSSFTTYPVASGEPEIIARDFYDNVVASAVVNMEKQVFFANIEGIGLIPAIKYDFVTWYLDFTSLTEAKTYSVLLTLLQKGGLLASYYTNSDFTGMLEDLDYYNHASMSKQKYTQIDATVNFDWVNSGPLTNQNNFFAIVWEGAVLAPKSETITFYIQADDFVRVVFNGSTVADTLTSRTNLSELTWNQLLVQDQFYSIKIEYVEQAGTASCILSWSGITFSKEPIPSTNLFAYLNSETSPMSVVMTPIDTDAPSCIVMPDGSEILTEALSAIEKTYNIEARDKYGNLQSHEDDIFTCEFYKGDVIVTCEITAVSPGNYQARITPIDLEQYTFDVYLQKQALALLVRQILVTVGPGLTDPTLSFLENVDPGAAGEVLFVTLITLDSNENVRDRGGDRVEITITQPPPPPPEEEENPVDPDGDLDVDVSSEVDGASADSDGASETEVDEGFTLAQENINVIDKNDGTYRIEYRITIVGTYDLTVTLNSDTDNTITDALEIMHAEVDPTSSTVTAPETGTINDEEPVPAEYIIELKDKYLNPITNVTQLYGYAIKESNPNFAPVYLTFAEDDLTAGILIGTLIVTTEAADASGECGGEAADPVLCNFFGQALTYLYVVQPGLLGKYYSNKNFSGDPALTRGDGPIEFDWDVNEIEGISADNVSVRWEGMLYVLADATYTLHVASTDQFTLYFDGEQVLDTDIAEFVVDLTADSYHTIQLDYVEETAQANVALQWKQGDGDFETIPAENLWNQLPDMIGNTQYGIILS